ncbi:MAG TPA: hypothetical protein PLC08_01825 [Candidatus Bipolaricaulis sp.]|nr:hypothetical protein [Candidatus Bipolaricaulis sp.]HRS13700.1 hypothetical protein [Candidatus Bipolaricaulis sp.]HRU21592.1 hypothetical protein [Candidatus Bipolaricaulis sp.]
MRRMIAVGVLVLGAVAAAASPVVILYSGGFGYVRELREVELAQEGELILDGLPLTMLVDSLVVDGLTVARVDPLERGSTAIEGLVGTMVTVFAYGERFAGRLLATGPGLVLSTVDGLLFLSSYDRIVAPVPVEPPTADQLSLKVSYRDGQSGWAEIGVRYLAEGLSWNVTYTATLADAALQLCGVVGVENQTGVEFRGAQVSLVAGEVYRPTAKAPAELGVRALALPSAYDAAPAFEYHRYTFPEPLDLTSGIAWAPFICGTLPFTRAYRFSGGAIEARVRFTNALGPLPAGEIRFYDEGGELFVGAAAIGHTPLGSDVDLAVGAAFDLTGERVQESRQRITDALYRDTYRITLRSAKDAPVEVEVVEALPGTWTITEHSLPYERLDAQRVLFRVLVPAGGTADVRYTVEWRY